MRQALCIVLLALLTSAAAQEQTKGERLRAALERERAGELDDGSLSGAEQITAAGERFIIYFDLATTKAERDAIAELFERVCNRIESKLRERLNREWLKRARPDIARQHRRCGA